MLYKDKKCLMIDYQNNKKGMLGIEYWHLSKMFKKSYIVFYKDYK